MTALMIENLTVRRGSKIVVDGVSLNVEPGRITTLLGPNGAGKSSLVLALAGLLPIAAGRVVLGGKGLGGLKPEAVRALGVAAVPEGHRVLNSLSVADNLKAAGFHLPAAGVPESTRAVYDIFPELVERRDVRAGSLSGGQQQMLALGQAMVARPRFILVDEMSLGLAPLIVKRLMAVIGKLAEGGTGVLLIEQFTDVALRMACDAHVMSRGQLSFSGPPQQLLDDPGILHRAYLA